MKKSECKQLELNFDGEENISTNRVGNANSFKTAISEKNCESDKNVDYSFTNRLSQKTHSSENKIYSEIIMLAKHI